MVMGWLLSVARPMFLYAVDYDVHPAHKNFDILVVPLYIVPA